MFVHRAPHSLKFKLACHASYARQKSLKPTFHGIARIHNNQQGADVLLPLVLTLGLTLGLA